jgi:hypothetical protein
MSRFPASCRQPAFASWSSIARSETGPSLRSAYRSPSPGRTRTGLSRCTRMRCGRGGCPLYPADCGAHTAGNASPAASDIRRGKRTPHVSKWRALAGLVGAESAEDLRTIL